MCTHKHTSRRAMHVLDETAVRYKTQIKMIIRCWKYAETFFLFFSFAVWNPDAHTAFIVVVDVAAAAAAATASATIAVVVESPSQVIRRGITPSPTILHTLFFALLLGSLPGSEYIKFAKLILNFL